MREKHIEIGHLAGPGLVNMIRELWVGLNKRPQAVGQPSKNKFLILEYHSRTWLSCLVPGNSMEVHPTYTKIRNVKYISMPETNAYTEFVELASDIIVTQLQAFDHLEHILQNKHTALISFVLLWIYYHSGFM